MVITQLHFKLHFNELCNWIFLWVKTQNWLCLPLMYGQCSWDTTSSFSNLLSKMRQYWFFLLTKSIAGVNTGKTKICMSHDKDLKSIQRRLWSCKVQTVSNDSEINIRLRTEGIARGVLILYIQHCCSI